MCYDCVEWFVDAGVYRNPGDSSRGVFQKTVN